jgi:hypothetical protein
MSAVPSACSARCCLLFRAACLQVLLLDLDRREPPGPGRMSATRSSARKVRIPIRAAQTAVIEYVRQVHGRQAAVSQGR